MSDSVVVTVTVVPGLTGPFAWWADDAHLALRATCVHDLPAVLEAAAAAVRDQISRS